MEFKLNDYHRNITDDELLEDIKRVAKELKMESITTAEYMNGGGKYHFSTFIRRFGSWLIALQKCGLSISHTQITSNGIKTKDLLDDLQRVSLILEKKTFLSSEYSQYGRFSKNVFFRRFGSWNKALKEAGLEPFDHPLGGGSKNKISEYECLEEIERMWIELGRQPTTTDIYNGKSRYSIHVFERRFGSWRKALEFFVDYINGEKELDYLNDNDEEEDTPSKISITEELKPVHKTKREPNLRMKYLVIMRDNCRCRLCGRSPATNPGLTLQIDHIIPWSKGGETVFDNLQTLCSDCNLGKSNLD